MLHKMDDYLIDRVFQPTADALWRVASCYGLAAFFYTGFMFIFASCRVINQSYFSLLFFMLWMPLRAFRAYREDQKPARNVVPIYRVSEFYLRVLDIPLVVASVACAVIPDSSGVIFRIGEISWVLLFLGDYFMACRKRPPAQSRSEVSVWGARPASFRS
jgi:hypothetical protein